MTDLNNTLKERGSKYGDFSDNARISEGIIRGLQSEEGYQNLRDIHKAALNVIAQKIARIINGDPEYKDNWHDIQGYAKLTEDRCYPAVVDTSPFFVPKPSNPIVDDMLETDGGLPYRTAF